MRRRSSRPRGAVESVRTTSASRANYASCRGGTTDRRLIRTSSAPRSGTGEAPTGDRRSLFVERGALDGLQVGLTVGEVRPGDVGRLGAGGLGLELGDALGGELAGVLLLDPLEP